MLDIDKKPEQQGYAAWAIGTAVKDNFGNNDYDEFQYWLLESDETHPSELILKTNNKKDKNYDENKIEFQNKIDNDGKNDLTGKLKTGIGKDFSFDDDNHDIRNQNDINNDDKSKNNNDNEISNNDDKSKNNNDNDISNDDVINDKSDKHYDNDNDNANNDLSLIPVTKNQAISPTKNQKNSNVDNNNDKNKNESIQKSMTGIQKLVSLLYHSTNNETFIMQNRPNLDDLQLKVLYAISAACRDDDVQESLFKVEKSDFSFVNNDSGNTVDWNHALV